MAIENFEETLSKMTKPEISELKHEDMLPGIIMKAKDKSVVSFWWLCIPLYVIAAFVMKSLFVPNASFLSVFNELASSKRYTAILLFFVLPLILIAVNLLSIKQLTFLYASLKRKEFIKTIFVELLIIIFSLLVLIIYFL